MSEEWRKVAECRRPVSRLELTVSADADIEIRSSGGTVVDSISLWAGGSWQSASFLPLAWLRDPFSIWLKSNDPNCQCSLHAGYIEETTTLPLALDMRYLYGPMGLGIPLPYARPITISRGDRPNARGSDYDYLLPDIGERFLGREVKEDKPQTPVPGITRLQAFKRELDEEKPKEKEVKKKK